MGSRAQARQLLEIDLRAALKRVDRIFLVADPCSPYSARATRGATEFRLLTLYACEETGLIVRN
jgi:hypothetical protein